MDKSDIVVCNVPTEDEQLFIKSLCQEVSSFTDGSLYALAQLNECLVKSSALSDSEKVVCLTKRPYDIHTFEHHKILEKQILYFQEDLTICNAVRISPDIGVLWSPEAHNRKQELNDRFDNEALQPLKESISLILILHDRLLNKPANEHDTFDLLPCFSSNVTACDSTELASWQSDLMEYEEAIDNYNMYLAAYFVESNYCYEWEQKLYQTNAIHKELNAFPGESD